MMEGFTEHLEANDWKDSAAIVGLIRFFEFSGISYNRTEIFNEDGYGFGQEYREGFDILKFNAEEITEERLTEFIESYFYDEMHHCSVEEVFSRSEWSEKEIEFVNKKMTANTVMKKVFARQKFDGTNKETILDLIQNNRSMIVKETYRNKTNLYRNFCNENVFQHPAGDTVRLRGYYVDFAKKGKSVSYRHDTRLFRSSDSAYYDFIPFAFSIGRESFFINDNYSIEQLYHTNKMLREKCEAQKQKSGPGSPDIRKVLFENIIYAADFIDFDVEIIKKDIEKPYFETFFLRKDSIDIFREIKKYDIFCWTIRRGERTVSIQESVTDAISNLQLMDGLIEFLLREDVQEGSGRYVGLIRRIVDLNALIRRKVYDGGENMNKGMRSAYAGAENAVKVLTSRNQKNKINSYRAKLLSALVFNDHNRFSEILLSLSNFTDVYFPFAYDLFEDFEANKEVAYTFVNNFNDYLREKAEEETKDE